MKRTYNKAPIVGSSSQAVIFFRGRGCKISLALHRRLETLRRRVNNFRYGVLSTSDLASFGCVALF
jgi:hypothetical protein